MRRIFFRELGMKAIVIGVYVGFVALVTAAAPAVAQGQGAGANNSTAPTKIGFVNTREILRQTPGYARAESLYSKDADSVQTEIQKLQASFDSAMSDFQRRSAMLSETQRAAKRQALEQQQQKSQQRAQELQEKMVARERELLEPIQSRIDSVIEGIRAAGSYAIIFDIGAPNSGIVRADRTLDLTQKVIQQLK